MAGGGTTARGSSGRWAAPLEEMGEGAKGPWARRAPPARRVLRGPAAGPPALTPSRHTLSSRRAMAREPRARARRRPRLKRERPGPALACPGAAAAARPSPDCGARRSGGRSLAGPRPGPFAAGRAGPVSAAGRVPRPPERHSRRHLGTPARSPDLPAHLSSHHRREGGARRGR